MHPVKTKKKLSRADKKQIDAAIVRANRTDKKGKSAQDSIPYERMWPDGICRVSDSHYTKTIQFQDINYQLSQNEDKTAIFEGWCDFLNYFDSSIHFQLSFLNLAASEETFANSISIPPQRDAFDSIREEYTTMLQNQLARGNNGLIKTKYLTFGIDADSIKAAKPRLERIETDILNNFKWRYDDLPILPEYWQMVVGKDKKKQFDILKKLMNAPDVSEVVNACDAGREGELIFRSVYELAGCQKPMKRLWISSMEDSAIREGFANLRPGADYDGLRDAALCRAKADWLVGINATRLFSVLYHRTLNIGRVMSPTLALIVQREAEIDTFKPVPFYTVALELPGLTVSGERMADKAAAKQLKETCQGAAATIKKVECKEKSEKPPALYDLTTLQRDANRLLGFTAQQTLDYLQSLYEKKLCTYPRTDSRYLTGDMADSLPVLVNLVANAMPFRKGIAITCDSHAVINDKKVTDHHAVIPTRNLKDADLSALPAGELLYLAWLCLLPIPRRMVQFC